MWKVKIPIPAPTIGSNIRTSKKAGNMMSHWVLMAGGEVMPIQTSRALTPSKYNQPLMQDRMRDFDEFIKKKYGDSI